MICLNKTYYSLSSLSILSIIMYHFSETEYYLMFLLRTMRKIGIYLFTSNKHVYFISLRKSKSEHDDSHVFLIRI